MQLGTIYAGGITLGKVDMDAWRADTAKYLPVMEKQSEKFLTEWIASVTDPARHYLLLRNAWDFNPSLLRAFRRPGCARGEALNPKCFWAEISPGALSG